MVGKTIIRSAFCTFSPEYHSGYKKIKKMLVFYWQWENSNKGFNVHIRRMIMRALLALALSVSPPMVKYAEHFSHHLQ
jgi:hypothetical protein